MTKTKLTRNQVQNLFVALQVTKELDIPSKFRYALSKNTRSLESEIKATQEAFPEPKKEKGKEEEFEKLHKEWEEKIDPHLKEEVEVELHKTPLVEINDTVHVDEARRNIQNQLLVEALMPIWSDNEEEA